MAYERTEVAENSNANQSAPQAIMREERTVNPYAQRKQPLASAPSAPPVGQPRKDGDALAVAPAKPAVETAKLSPQMAALARKEQKFRQSEAKLAAESKALETERAELAELKALKAKLAAKDFSGIESLVDYEAYSTYQLNKLQSEDPIKKELEAIKAEVSGIKKTDEERVSKAYELAISQRRDAAKALVASDEKFSTIKALGREEAVVQHILETWEEDKEELSVEQATQEVEDALYERAQKYSSVPKLKKTAPVEVAPPVVEEKKPLPPMKTGLKTITNQVNAGEIKKALKPLSLMSQDERYAEARRRAEAKLAARQPQPSA
jgi:hypothetical protein